MQPAALHLQARHAPAAVLKAVPGLFECSGTPQQTGHLAEPHVTGRPGSPSLCWHTSSWQTSGCCTALHTGTNPAAACQVSAEVPGARGAWESSGALRHGQTWGTMQKLHTQPCLQTTCGAGAPEVNAAPQHLWLHSLCQSRASLCLSMQLARLWLPAHRAASAALHAHLRATGAGGISVSRHLSSSHPGRPADLGLQARVAAGTLLAVHTSCLTSPSAPRGTSDSLGNTPQQCLL